MKKKNEEEVKHKPCRFRKRETRDGVAMDWCYAIGCCYVGDMPCEYCSDWENGDGKEKVDYVNPEDLGVQAMRYAMEGWPKGGED